MLKYSKIKINILVENYISENLKHLIEKERTSMDEFGEKFNLNRGIVSQYIRKVSVPKLETIQKICVFYDLTLDAFVNTELSKINKYEQKEIKSETNEPPEGFGFISLKYVELLEKSVDRLENSVIDKERIIKTLEEKLGNYDKSKTG